MLWHKMKDHNDSPSVHNTTHVPIFHSFEILTKYFWTIWNRNFNVPVLKYWMCELWPPQGKVRSNRQKNQRGFLENKGCFVCAKYISVQWSMSKNVRPKIFIVALKTGNYQNLMWETNTYTDVAENIIHAPSQKRVIYNASLRNIGLFMISTIPVIYFKHIRSKCFG